MTPRNRHLYCAELMALATESLDAAQKNLDMDLLKVAVSQGYYAMFYAASALLAARDIHRHRHGGVMSAFDEQFCKTADMEPRFGSMLRKAHGMRIDCDYKIVYRQGGSAAGAAVERAREFLQAADERLKVELEKLG